MLACVVNRTPCVIRFGGERYGIDGFIHQNSIGIYFWVECRRERSGRNRNGFQPIVETLIASRIWRLLFGQLGENRYLEDKRHVEKVFIEIHFEDTRRFVVRRIDVTHVLVPISTVRVTVQIEFLRVLRILPRIYITSPDPEGAAYNGTPLIIPREPISLTLGVCGTGSGTPVTRILQTVQYGVCTGGRTDIIEVVVAFIAFDRTGNGTRSVATDLHQATLHEEKRADVRNFGSLDKDLGIRQRPLRVVSMISERDALSFHKRADKGSFDGMNRMCLPIVAQQFKLKDLLFIEKIARVDRISDNLAARADPAASVVDLPLVRLIIVIAGFVRPMAQNRIPADKVGSFPSRLLIHRFF